MLKIKINSFHSKSSFIENTNMHIKAKDNNVCKAWIMKNSCTFLDNAILSSFTLEHSRIAILGMPDLAIIKK